MTGPVVENEGDAVEARPTGATIAARGAKQDAGTAKPILVANLVVNGDTLTVY